MPDFKPLKPNSVLKMLTLIKHKYNNLVSDTRFSEILTGSVWALSARVAAAGLGILVSIILARHYGSEAIGLVALVNSFLLLATIFTVLGTNTSILRLIPEHLVKFSPSSAYKVYHKTQYLVIGVSLATGALFFWGSEMIADKVFSKPHMSFYFSIASVFVVFKSLMLLNTQAIRGLRLIKVFALMQCIPQGWNLALLVFLGFIWSSPGIPVYALLGGFAATGIIGWIIMEVAFREKMRPEDRISLVPVKQILAISMPMFMTAAITFFITETGVMILGMYRDEAEIGYYSIAVRLSNLTTFVLSAVNSMAAPKFAELFHSNKLDDLFYVAKKSAKLIFFTTAPILLALLLLGRPVLSILYGKEFIAAYPALIFGLIGQFINAISGSTGFFMNMTGNQDAYRNIMFMTAVLNISLNFLIVPHYGLYGAAFTGMVSIIFWNFITLAYIKKKYGHFICYFPFF